MNFVNRLKKWIADPFGQHRIQKLKVELVGYQTLVEVLREEISDLEKTKEKFRIEASRTEMRNKMLKASCVINQEIDKMRGCRHLNFAEVKALYDSVKSVLDPDGMIKFQAAQDILGKFDEMHFPYEANCGFFEGDIYAEKGSYRALLIQYAHKLGQPKNAERWEEVQAAGGYERCIDWSIDETTPEYMKFERDLYANIFSRFYVGPVPFIEREREKKCAPADFGPLYHADPNCDHDIVAQSSGGVKCTKCGGWFAY